MNSFAKTDEAFWKHSIQHRFDILWSAQNVFTDKIKCISGCVNGPFIYTVEIQNLFVHSRFKCGKKNAVHHHNITVELVITLFVGQNLRILARTFF